MCDSAEDLKSQARWDGASGRSRRNLLKELSSRSKPHVGATRLRDVRIDFTVRNDS